MAHIKPFRAWRYQPDLVPRLSTLIAPPFDTISESEKHELYRQPYNSIHLSVPVTNQEAAQDLRQWKSQGILRQDADPAIYGYYQQFARPGDDVVHYQKGFICFIEATSWDEKVVLRHEDTIPHSVEDRVELLAATQLQASPTHGLYTDTACRLEVFWDASMERPLYDVEDRQGVRHIISCIRNPAIIREFVEVLRNKPVILADGHHRYESSLRYRKQCEAATVLEASAADASAADASGADASGADALSGCHYHMMYLTNTEGSNAHILPTHRVLRSWPTLNLDAAMEKARRYFSVEPLKRMEDIPGAILNKPGSFGVALAYRAYRLQLKPDKFDEFPTALAAEIKELDTTAVHYFFIDRVLGIPYDEQRKSAYLSYESDFAQVVQQLERGSAALALVLQPVSMNQVKRVCYGGHLMPQKSTYFYPKAVSGFVFGSIRPDEL